MCLYDLGQGFHFPIFLMSVFFCFCLSVEFITLYFCVLGYLFYITYIFVGLGAFLHLHGFLCLNSYLFYLFAFLYLYYITRVACLFCALAKSKTSSTTCSCNIHRLSITQKKLKIVGSCYNRWMSEYNSLWVPNIAKGY